MLHFLYCHTPHNGNRAEYAVTEIFYCHDVFTGSGAWILHKKLCCLSHLVSSLRQKLHILGGEGEYKLAEWGDCGVICQNVLMIILAQLVLNTVEKEHIYLLCMFGVICGKEKISVWEMAFGYSAHHQQSVNIFDGIVRTSLKRTNRDGGVAHCLDPTSPPRLMSNEQSL